MRRQLLRLSVLSLLAAGCGKAGHSGTSSDADSGTVPPSSELVLDHAAADALSGQLGRVSFEARTDGERGAVATFRMAAGGETSGDGGRRASASPTLTLEVHIGDEQHGELTFNGTTLDGAGALAAPEQAALAALESHAAFGDIALIPLDVACATQELEPRVMAALLFPYQAVLKYLTPARAERTGELAKASHCSWFMDPKAAPDHRAHPVLPLLANGQVVPAAFGYLPFDDAGALPEANVSRSIIPADQNVFGPGNSMCRGACGADCEENNCGQPRDEWRCLQQNGHNTGEKERFQRYTCGEHPGCIEHDACFDNCKAVFGVGSFTSGLCMRGCDLQAASGYGAGQGLEWAQGHGPYTHEKTYDYATGERVRDEQLCPLAFGLTAMPSSGLAPFSTTIKWTGDLNDPGQERCRLELGDGTPPVDLEPCPASGEYEHIYSVPSEMRTSSGLYTVMLTRIGAAQTTTTDVQARFRFDAAPASGKAPLSTLFSWAGFDLVTKTLSCTLDFGDGSAPAMLENCAKTPGASHDYAKAGVYTARLTVRGEDRPVSKTLTIEVTKPSDPPASDCASLRDIKSWTASASFDYSISASDSRLSITHSASGTMRGTLSVSSAGPSGISFSDTAPSGTVSLHEVEIKPAPYQNNPWYAFEGSDIPVPKLNSDDSGSNILLNFDLAHCRYNVHAQAVVKGTATQGKDSGPAQSWVSSFQSEWLPLPAGTSLSGNGDYPGHTEAWILTTPELARWYWIMNPDLEQTVSEDAFGNAHVSWQFAPVQ